jgi:LuxR family maltose regulon positive regulatory protein
MPTAVQGVLSAAHRDLSTDPLVASRLALPSAPKLHVERDRLISCLDRGADQPLTLVSAPAGSGKTALVAAWAARREPRGGAVAWITFEAGDDRPGTFWPLVVECLRRHGVPVPVGSAASWQTHRRPLTDLCAALASLTEPLSLVLDGYELVDVDLSKDIEFVLAHCGRRLRLVILTRVDPVFPLHRFRLADTIAELRMGDLAFSPDETAQLVRQSGVSLTDASVAALVGRTRGWAAGLRFAVMVLARADDPDAAVARLVGDTGNIAEYLMSEILQTQSAEVRDLLLRTSVVEVLQPGLIEELGGRSAGRGLATLAHANILVEELPGQPGWYRYHPFLRDLLRAELAYASPSRFRRLRRRAAHWYAGHGAVDEAVALATASSAWTEAASYAVEGLAVGRVIVGDDSGGLVTALRQAPRNSGGPSGAVIRAALAIADNSPADCARELAAARESLDSATDSPLPAVELAMEVVDTVRACSAGDPEALALAEHTAARLAEHPRGGASTRRELSALIQTSRGIAQLRVGSHGEAGRTLTAAVQAAQESGCPPLPISSLAHLALAESLQGRLDRARDCAVRSVALAEETRIVAESRPPAAEIALGWVSTERGDLRAGCEHIDAALRSRHVDPIAQGLSAVVRARLLRSGGAPAEAIALVNGVAARVPGQATWLDELLAIEMAESHIARGDPDQAVDTARALEGQDAGTAALAVGHAHLARGDWAGVADALTDLVGTDTVLPAPLAVGARLLEAALELHRGRRRRAIAALDQSLRTAAPEGLRRPFLDAPASVRHLLHATPDLLAQHPWLDASAGRRPPSGHRPTAPVGAGPDTLTGDEIIEPLTTKEREVLGHLAELLTTEEIAAAMFVSVNTVRTHVRSILRKLSVSRRNEAIRRARALCLIGH